MDAPYLDKLNPQQRSAASSPLETPLLIIAGAGTGKTNTLAHRVAHLIQTGVNPARILLLTFTRRAAQEMTRRAESALANCSFQPANGSGATSIANRKLQIGNKIWSGTFHAISTRLLRMHAQSLGLSENFTVMDRSDAEDFLNICRSDLALDRGDVRFPRKGTCLAIYSRCVNAQEPIEAALKHHFPWCQAYPDQLKNLFREYTNRKLAQNLLDYDDLLLYWFHAMNDEAVAAEVRGRFDAILVDEYQDTNALQAAILKNLSPEGRGVTVVGDDAQSIYSFRAATVHNILDFPQIFPGAVVQKLEQNYRSVQPILDATNAVIAICKDRYNKDLFSHRKSAQKPKLVTVMDEEQQSDYLIKQILDRFEAGIALKKQAVLFRTAHHSDALEVELSRRNIPYVKYGGLKFLEAAHIKDALSFLRLAENAKDTTSAHRLLQLLDGFGPAHTRRAIDFLTQNKFDLRAWADFVPPAAASQQWIAFIELMLKLNGIVSGQCALLKSLSRHPEEVLPTKDLASQIECQFPQAATASFGMTFRESRSAEHGQSTTDNGPRTTDNKSPSSPPELADQISLVRAFYSPILEKRYDNFEPRQRDLEQLQQISSHFASRRDLLTDLTLDPPSNTQDLAGPPLFEEDYLILSTIHSAKGCEWDAVYVIHAADGNIPSDMSTGSAEEIEEERRLFYVALTRAKDFLEVTFPLKYYHKKHRTGDAHSYAQLTRFLPESILQHFERVNLQPRPKLTHAPASSAQSDIKKKIAAMWT